MDLPYLYKFAVAYSEEDGGYIATVANLPGCSAFGKTKEAATAEVIPAIRAWIAACEEAGNPVPSPSG